MIHCKNCGVELDEPMNFCPLCGTPVFNEASEEGEKLMREKNAGSGKLKREIDILNRVQKRKLVWETISIILGAGILSTLVLNIFVSQSIVWWLYTLIGGLTIFAYASVYSFVRKEFLVLSGIFIITALSLLSLDLLDQRIAWSVQLGVPLLIAAWVVMILLLATIRYAREKGFNVIAYIFLALGVLSIAVEGILSLYMKAGLRLNWSLIAFFSALPVAITLLYIHYKLRKGSDLRKFFHI